MTAKAMPYPPETLYRRQPQRTFRGRHLLQITLPMGGIGAGCIGLNGQGGLQDFSIRNTPATTALADGHAAGDAAFATLYLPASGVARLVEGPMPAERVYDQGLKGQGYRAGGHEGLPRFREVTFTGSYPFGQVTLADPEVPLKVRLTGFNPFIPLDDKDSSLPCAILEYTLSNPTGERVPYELGYHLSHLAFNSTSQSYARTRNQAIPGAGVYLYNVEAEGSPLAGSCALGVVGATPLIKAQWFRGGWFDGISALWREVSTGSFTPNDASTPGSQGRNGGSILVKGELAPGEQVTLPIVLAWYFPNVDTTYGGQPAAPAEDACGPECACHPTSPRWQPYYTTQWKDAWDVVAYVRDHYASLRARTQAFHDALFHSTLPGYVLDAVSANLAILKSPTVLRQANGNVWAWEGCFSTSGCCHGSCTHVWNYAQAMPHLFPALERTLREQELERSMDERGHVTFRAALPDGPVDHTFHAAADGQLGGIMKLYREWQISGDQGWLAELYPLARRSLDFCIATWDPDHLGVPVEPHHNTYDIEFWGPDGLIASFYLGALEAMTRLAQDAGHPEDAPYYRELAQKGARYLEERLFNGEYFEQKVMLEGLRASPSAQALAQLRVDNPEEYDLLVKEGPKYQYGRGCMSDGVFGAWLARLCGLESAQNQESIRAHLKSVFAYNFKPSLWGHANLQRPGYAMGDEPGLLVCTWPHGGKPTLPFPYSDEVWTGIEYQAAAHMIAAGLVDEGLTVVKAARSRYDGLARNPWNEYECGNYYARAMASYGLLIALSGFRYSAPEKTLYLAPRLKADPFQVFFSTSSGWGTLRLHGRELAIEMVEGWLEVDRLVVEWGGKAHQAEPHVKITAGKMARVNW